MTTKKTKSDVSPFLLVASLSLFALAVKLREIGSVLTRENILATHDAFRFARFARELQTHTYPAIDYLANIPDFAVNADPPPLLSLLAVWLSSLFPVRLEALFALLPPVLSVLFIIPFYFWTRTFAGPHVFLGGAFLGTFNYLYFIRTRPGYFDTDCLILFFVFLIILCITYAARERENTRTSLFFVLLAGIAFKLFMWWYSLSLFGPLFTFSLCAGLIAFRHSKRDILLKTGVFLLIVNPFAVMMDQALFLKDYVLGHVLRMKAYEMSIDIYQHINENRPVGPNLFVLLTTENSATAGLGAAGLLLFLLRRFRSLLIPLPLILIGAASVKLGARYLIYLGPFLGMGLGYVVQLLAGFLEGRFPRRRTMIAPAGIVLVLFLSFPAQRLYYESLPLFDERTYQNITALDSLTEKNSSVWSWWDYGNPIEYLSGRATYLDNTQFKPHKVYLVARSLLTEQEEKARRMIAFLTNTTTPDTMKLAEIEEKALAYTAPPRRPVYVYLYDAMLYMAVLQGTGLQSREITGGKGLPFGALIKCSPEKGKETSPETLFNCFAFSFDDAAKTIIPSEKIDPEKLYREIWYRDRAGGETRVLSRNRSAEFDKTLQIVRTKTGELYALLVDRAARGSVLNRMFALKDTFTNFEPVYDDFPNMVVYRVRQ
ncbi:MAG: STT3 domain-containing protein [Thermodesulfovibrionales bacterium]